MTCNEFQDRFHRILDSGGTASSDPALVAHLAACAQCERWSRDLTVIDAELRALPREPIPHSLLASLHTSVPVESPTPPPVAWGPDVKRAAVLLIPGILLWACHTSLPAGLQPLVIAVLAYLGTFVYASSILRRYFLGPAGG